MSIANDPVILFDGVCLLCNRAVRLIAARDRRRRFRFASLQSPVARHFLVSYRHSADQLDSLVLIDDGVVHLKSDAVLHIVRGLSGGWPLLGIFRFLPRPLRDWLYDLVAQRRYSWFGRRDTCMIPDAELADRFLDPDDSSGLDPLQAKESP